MKFAACLVLAVVSLLSRPEAHAEREIRFAAYDTPSSGTVAIPVRQDGWRDGAFADVDAASGGALLRAVEAVSFHAEADQQLDLPGVGPFDRVILVGVGEGPLTPRDFENAGGRIGQAGANSPAERIEILWAGDERHAGEHLAFGAALGQYRFTKYREADAGSPVVGEGEFVIRTADGAADQSIYRSQWAPVSRAVAFTRDLISEPANTIYPETFVQRVREYAGSLANVRLEVLDVPAMEKLGMGAILAVGKGSQRPPRLMVVRYDGGSRGDAPLAFVGKGITFDSGGISLKDNDGMWRMKYDLSGAAAATGAVLALAGRKAPVNAIAVAALAENMPSGSSGRPGDVIRTMSGKTFEVMSTDAEGRMVLSDAVWYAQQQFKPRLMIDLATLTGSVRTALGDEYAGVFSRHDSLAGELVAAGEKSGEDLWRLPLHPSYGKDLESPIADLRNSAGPGSGAGAGVGAYFIGAWVDEAMPWAHLDIAGMAWREAEGSPTAPAGATGYGVRLLDRFVREYHE